jgi:hypothetical protein
MTVFVARARNGRGRRSVPGAKAYHAGQDLANPLHAGRPAALGRVRSRAAPQRGVEGQLLSHSFARRLTCVVRPTSQASR